MRVALVALAVLALLVAAWLVLDGPGGTGGGPEDVDRAPEAPYVPPALVESADGGRPDGDGRTTGPARGSGPGVSSLPGAALPGGPRLRGTVVDAETGAAVPGAVVWAEPAAEGCPRFPFAEFETRAEGGVEYRGRGTLSRSDERGAFEVALHAGDGGKSDLFVEAKGFVLAVACAVEPGTPTAIRLVRGAAVTGVVVATDGRAVAVAGVRAEPAPGRPEVPGARAQAVSDAEGRFTLEGLARAPVAVTADHPKFVPARLESVDPGSAPVRIVLVPAFLATFRLRTGDGGEPKTPSVAWRATGRGKAALEEVAILVRATPGEPEAEERAEERGREPWVEHEPLRIPCDRADVVFQVKAEGYAPWTGAPEPLPAEGGEKTYEVTLERDLSLGGMKVLLEDRDGKRLSWAEVGAQARFARRDQVEVPGGIVMRSGEALSVPALPAGPYQVWVRSPGYAPRSMPVDVVPGRETEARAVLGPPARLRVRFTSPQATVVRFRVFAGDEPTFPFVEGAAREGAAATEDVPDLHAGADGVLLSGLGGGPHSVVVVSEDLDAPRTTVDLVEGDTREVEIAVTPR